MLKAIDILSVLESNNIKYFAVSRSGQELEVTPDSVGGITVYFNGMTMDTIKRKLGDIKSFVYEIDGVRKNMVKGTTQKSTKPHIKYTNYVYFRK